jgi:hypothetical protein
MNVREGKAHPPASPAARRPEVLLRTGSLPLQQPPLRQRSRPARAHRARRQEPRHLVFTPNESKHDEGLTIEYSGVSRIEVVRRREIDWMAQDTVLLDEILPHEDGCRHETALADSTLVIYSTDLLAILAPT